MVSHLVCTEESRVRVAPCPPDKRKTVMEENISANPKAVIDAVIEAPKTFGDITIGDITLLKYAYLEKLHSPFIDPSQEFTVENIAPSIFVLAVDKKELRKYGSAVDELKLDALDWADEHLKIEDVPAVIKAIVDKLTQINKAAPSGTAADPKKN